MTGSERLLLNLAKLAIDGMFLAEQANDGKDDERETVWRKMCDWNSLETFVWQPEKLRAELQLLVLPEALDTCKEADRKHQNVAVHIVEESVADSPKVRL